MTREEIARLWHGLRGGTLAGFQREGDILRFQVIHPDLAAAITPGSTRFLCALQACARLDLQPFRNEDMMIRDLAAIERLELRIESAEPSPSGVSVYCQGKGAMNASVLRVAAAAFGVWDEGFDPISVAQLEKRS